MQLAAARRIAPPRLPGDEEVEAEAEAGLEDDEAAASGPALRQLVPLQEDVAALAGAARGAVVDVVERRRVRRAVDELEFGRDQHFAIRLAPMKYRKNDAKAYARQHLRGIWAATLTPFTATLALDEAGWRRNLRHWYRDLGLAGLFVNGKQAEFASLSIAERKRLAEMA